MENLALCEANNVPLTPITFLKRAAECYPNRTSIIDGETRFTWPQTYDRCCRLAASLISLNIAKNDVVSVVAPNITAMYEMYFAVPMARAVLNPINTRLDATSIAAILRHAKPKILFIDRKFEPLARETLHLLSSDDSQLNLLVIFIDDINCPKRVSSEELDYEGLIQRGEPTPSLVARMFRIQDEQDPISLNYTSGTTSDPKGVVSTHRGAYLSSLSAIIGWELGTCPVYLWTLPMFHCNGWTLPWAMAARGGTNLCMRLVTAPEIYKNIKMHSVTHMCCVPTVFNILLQGNTFDLSHRSRPVHVLTGGSPPPAALLKKVQRLGFQVMHAYGLTEATGPVLFCEWQDEWNRLPDNQQMELKARQGLGILGLAEVDVKNNETQESVPRDGKTMGEIVLKGSSIMKGYLNNPKGTVEAFKHGWLNTGDVGVIHPDGHIEIKDRSKDIIISGGENISSVEVENVLYKHVRVLEAAVVAMPHPAWGETPCAFVVQQKGETDKEDRDDKPVTREKDLIDFCRENLPHFMCPRKVVFLEELPKNGNGKILKLKLRDIAKGLVDDQDEVNVKSKIVQLREDKLPVDHFTSRL
ncbi:PREDICTED: probable acyl-activating enzyme 12, peroxisomal [Camelina sativa]|uniref:Probable acyl-activating enzyme 12, peroxisomal n=1 Tax=Camelina sativa TaxID=90675 RepID=A0ABM0SRL6_CAMSA|nr:PREDICTED: probable acyl-activating enzyme 12, peroxisomal [Camelina sativa]